MSNCRYLKKMVRISGTRTRVYDGSWRESSAHREYRLSLAALYHHPRKLVKKVSEIMKATFKGRQE